MDSTIRIPVTAVDLLEDDLASTTVIPEMDCSPEPTLLGDGKGRDPRVRDGILGGCWASLP
jgi:hypothetical protein